ncbi:hypothetical protein NPIL_619001, partial [Nephila pilipes]
MQKNSSSIEFQSP